LGEFVGKNLYTLKFYQVTGNVGQNILLPQDLVLTLGELIRFAIFLSSFYTVLAFIDKQEIVSEKKFQ